MLDTACWLDTTGLTEGLGTRCGEIAATRFGAEGRMDRQRNVASEDGRDWGWK
jgi:hypothetical protein